MKHIRLRIFAALTCLALLMNVLPAIGEGDADFVDIPASTEIVTEQPASGGDAPTGSESTPSAPADTPAPTEDVTPSPSAEPTEDATPAPSAESTTEPSGTPTATRTPAEIRAAELGLSLDALAEALGVSTESLCAMTADEIDAALAALQSATDLSEDFEIESGVLVAYSGAGGDVVIPDGVTAIGPGAFQDCTALKSVTLPDGVREIGKSAFEGCTALTRVTLCDELRTIGPCAFKDCEALRAIDLPDKLETIGEFAFQGCERLEEVVLPNSLLQLGGLIDRDDQHIFKDCTALKSVTLPKDMRVLGASMFSGCTALEELSLPATLTAIESGAFSGCTSLQALTIPSGVTRIASDAFANCPNLRLTLSYGSAAETACKAAGTRYTYNNAPTGVNLSSPRTTIGVGEKLQLNVQLEPDDVVGTLTFSSSNTRYVTVDQNGIITGKRAGSATITVKTYNGVKATLKITVKNAPTSVSLKTTRALLGVGETAQLTATLSSGSAGGYSFSSSDETKLTVDASGLVTALDAGEVTVTVTTYNGKKRSGVITIVPAPEQITLSAEALTVGALDSATLGYSLNEGSAGAVSFASSDEAVATVDANGKIHALTEGSATITATTYNGISADCALTVVPAPTYIVLPYATLNIGLGDRIQLEPEIDPGCVSAYRYSSSNTRYATVSEAGVITAKSVGSVTVTIKTYNGLSFKLKVNVKKAPSSLKLSPTSLVLGVGESAQLGHSITSGTATTLGYQSSDADIAAVTESGMVTGLAEGEAIVTAATHNGKTATCSVTVVPAPESISVSAAELLGVGQTAQLSAALLPESAHSTLRYEVISGDAVTVDDSGRVQAVQAGSATVRVSTYVDGVYADHTILVKPAPESLSFDADSYVVDIDETLQLSPILTPADCHTELTYSIARAGFFTIDEDGLVTPIMRGATSVTVKTHNGLSATITIQVVDPYFPESIKFAVAPPGYLELGMTYQPEVLVYPETALADLVWASSNPKIISVDAKTGFVTALSYGSATITATSTRNPALILSYKLVVLSPERCLKMPNRRTTSTSSISTTLSQIKNVRASAYLELESLYARGIISESDYNTRKAIVSRAFDMYLFPWMTNSLELYWKAANSENGAKDFKPGIVYYGMPYTQSNRTYNVDTALKSGRFYSTGSGYYMMDGSKFSDRNYPGNDCSSFVSMAIWGMGSSHSSDTTRSIGTSSAYVTLSDPTDLRPGDILNKSGSHVIMFLYYADAAKTQMVIIEQGGGEFDTNTCSCSIRTISTYLDKGYKMLRLAKLS